MSGHYSRAEWLLGQLTEETAGIVDAVAAQTHATLALHDLVTETVPALATALAALAPAAAGPDAMWEDRDGDLWVFDPATGAAWQITSDEGFFRSSLRDRYAVAAELGPLTERPWPWAGGQ